MSEELKNIKDIMKYLNRVSNESKIGLINQDFFLDDSQLRILIENYYLEFNRLKELIEDLKLKYGHLKNLSFEKGDFLRVKDLSNNVRVKYSQKEHQAYAFKVHKFFINELEKKLNTINKLSIKDKQVGIEKELNTINERINKLSIKDKQVGIEKMLNIKTKKQTNKLSIKNKQVYELFKLIDLKLDIFKSGEEFIDSSVKEKNLEFYLNIKNTTFYYILSILKPYFYNFELQKFVTANKVHSKRGTILTKKNLHNSKSEHPSDIKLIDEILINFKK
tara:strand:+ start:300 stop:1130 length:831 start_codon:yes stop_codon:yes gene_type:complete